MAEPTRRIDKITRMYYKLTDALRDKRAFEAATGTPAGRDFTGFRHVRQYLLVTFKRSDEPVPCPMNFGLDDGKIYMRSEGGSAKIRRIRNEPQVLVRPCGLRGKPLGPAVAGTARIVSDSEISRAHAIIAANWSPGMKLLERGLDVAADRFQMPSVYFEITPHQAGDPTGRVPASSVR